MSETVTTTCNKCAGTRRWYPNASGSEPCPDCREPAETPCKRCGGRGTVMVPFKWERQTMPCSVCKGTGVAPPAAVPEPCEYVYKVLTPDGVYADGEWATLEAIPAKLPDRSEHYFDTADADKNLVPVVPPAVVPEPPLAHVFVSAGRFARAGSGADWRYCNTCGLVERADGTNKPCSGQFPPLSLRNDSEVPEPDAAFEKWAISPAGVEAMSYPYHAFLAHAERLHEQHPHIPSEPNPWRSFKAGYAAAQAKQRDALAGLVEKWERQSKSAFETYTKENTPIEILAEARERGGRYRACATELAALLEGQPE